MGGSRCPVFRSVTDDGLDWLRREPRPLIKSVSLTIFWRCSYSRFSSRNGHIEPPGNQPSTVLAEDLRAQQGLAMLIRGQIDGISGEVALAAATIPAALLPTLLIGGLLLTCP